MNDLDLKPYAYEVTGTDGKTYGMLTLATPEAVEHLKTVGLLPDDVREMVGYQTAVDTQVAIFERDMPGVSLQ